MWYSILHSFTIKQSRQINPFVMVTHGHKAITINRVSTHMSTYKCKRKIDLGALATQVDNVLSAYKCLIYEAFNPKFTKQVHDCIF